MTVLMFDVLPSTVYHTSWAGTRQRRGFFGVKAFRSYSRPKQGVENISGTYTF